MLETKGCDIGFTKLAIMSSNVKIIFRKESNLNYLSEKFVKNKVYEAVANIDISIYPGFSHYAGVFCLKGSSNHFVLNKSGPAIKLEMGNAKFLEMMLLSVRQKLMSRVNTNKFLADITFSIPCNEWPRTDRCWPSSEDVLRVTSMGCHLVPKSQEKEIS